MGIAEVDLHAGRDGELQVSSQFDLTPSDWECQASLAPPCAPWIPANNATPRVLEVVMGSVHGRVGKPGPAPLMAQHQEFAALIIRKLREADRFLAEGRTISEVSMHLEISEQSFHR